MKKIIPFVIIILIVVIGVIMFLVLNNSKDSNELEESIGKAQLIEVYDYNTSELLKTYENKEDIESLINNLGLDKWKLDIVVYASGEYVEFSAMGMEMSFKTNKNIANLFEWY